MADSEGRVPPWCRHCGADLKTSPKEPAPAATAQAPLQQPKLPSAAGPPAPNGQTKAPPYIHACIPGMLGKNMLYRIYFTSSDLLVFRIGSGTISAGQVLPSTKARVRPIGLGLLPMIAHSVAKRNEAEDMRLADRAKELEAADEPTLRDCVHTGDAAFALGPGDITWLRIDPPSGYIRVFCGVDHEGILKFEHRTAGKMKLALPSWKDAKKAIEELPKLFGDLVQVNLSWGTAARRAAEM
jgi:hypothetical protein